MKRSTFWLFALVLVLLTVDGAMAADYYDEHGANLANAAPTTVCVGYRFNTTETVNLTGVARWASDTANAWYLHNGTTRTCVGSATKTGTWTGTNLQSNISGGVTINAGETWTIVTNMTGGTGSYSMKYGNANDLNRTGNTTRIFYFNGLDNPPTIDGYIRNLRGFYYSSISGPGPNTITVSLTNSVNGSSWPSTVTFSNLTGNLSFAYFNITGTGYCVTVTGNGTTTNCTTTGSGASTFFNVSNNSISVTGSQTISAATYQALINVSAYRLFLNTSISAYNTTNGIFKNVSGSLVYALNGSNNIQVDVAGNYSKNITCTINEPLSTINCNATGIHDNLFTIGAQTGGVSVLNWSLQVTNQTLGGNLYDQSTTNGSIVFALLQGYRYFFAIQPPGYVYTNATLAANASTNLYNFSLQQSMLVNVSFYDEQNGSLIVGPNITMELISDAQSALYSTTTGRITTTVLLPENYTLLYYSTNYTTRTYQFTLLNNTVVALNLTMLLSTESTSATVTVIDDFGVPLSGYVVKLLRKDIPSNSYIVNQIFTTDSNGQGVVTIQLGNVLYYFTVELNGNVLLTTTPSFLYTNTIQLVVPGAASGFDDFEQNNAISGNITNQTHVYTFSYNDPDNIASSACIYAWSYTYNNKVLYNQTCSSSSSGSVSTTISNSTNAYYVIQGYVTKNDEDNLIDTVVADFRTIIGDEAGSKTGLFVMFFVILIIIFIFKDALRWMVIVGSLVPLLFSAFGLITVPVGITAVLWIAGIIIGAIIGE